jgi:signal transduction histidine kinase
MKAALQRQTWDIVISDYEMPNFGGFEALQLLKESGHDVPFILVSAVVSEETAVAAMKAGAHDYIMKRNLARLVPAIERELREAQSRVARKAAETALRQSEEQLRQVQKIEAVGRLAAGVAHDFNNILTAIMGHSELLLRQLDADDPRRKNAEQIEKVAHLAAGLTRQLLIFSRKQVIEPRVLNLNAVILDIKKCCAGSLGKTSSFARYSTRQQGTSRPTLAKSNRLS